MSTTGGSVPAEITNSNDTSGDDSTFTYAGNIANPSTFNGIFTDTSATNGGKLSLAVTSGSLTVIAPATTPTNAYTGNTTINGGATLTLNTLGSTPIALGNNIHNDGNLIVTDTFATSTVSLNSLSGAGTTTVSASTVVSAITLNQTGGLANNGTVTISGSGTVGPISGAGTLIVNGATQLAASSGLSQMASLSIGATGTFDVNNNHILINYGAGADPIASIAALLATGYAGGDWDGTGGIITSAPLVVGGLTYGLGYADGADPQSMATGLASGTIEIKYTLLGDADLNGIVNGIDFGILAANFNKGITGWDEGDFDYNNIVNGLDFGDLAANFNKGAAGTDAVAALDAFAAANGLMADVPEPVSIGMLGLAGLGVLQRRRPRRI